MKKKQLFILVAALSLIAAGCTKTSEGVTRITYYPVLTLEGAQYVTMEVGSSFSDPGYSAIMNGEDVTDQVEVTSNLDSSKPGMYKVNYSIVNEDGIAATASRYVIVAAAGDEIPGSYTTNPNSYRDNGSAQAKMGGAYQVIIYPNGKPNEYVVSDLLGGWYGQRAGYVSNYELVGTIQAKDGVVTLLGSHLIGWDDAALGFSNGTYGDGTIHWDVVYAYDTWTFSITIVKN